MCEGDHDAVKGIFAIQKQALQKATQLRKLWMLCEINVTKRFSFSFENNDAPPLPIQKLLTNLYYISKIWELHTSQSSLVPWFVSTSRVEWLPHFHEWVLIERIRKQAFTRGVAGRCQKTTLTSYFLNVNTTLNWPHTHSHLNTCFFYMIIILWY